jgi:hypothetical protein
MGDRPTPDARELGLPESVECPFCGGLDTELHSPFGPQLSVATYWCRHCHTAFDWVKRRGSHSVE